jgi:hypothetical protein
MAALRDRLTVSLDSASASTSRDQRGGAGSRNTTGRCQVEQPAGAYLSRRVWIRD